MSILCKELLLLFELRGLVVVFVNDRQQRGKLLWDEASFPESSALRQTQYKIKGC